MAIYIATNGETHGPYQTSELAEMLEFDQLDIPLTTYWTEGMEGWEPLANLNIHRASGTKNEPPPLPDRESTSVTPTHIEQPIKKRSSPMNYVVLQVILKEKFIGTGSGNLTELEGLINKQAAKGYRLHTISTASSGSKGFMGGDRIQATLVFEELKS